MARIRLNQELRNKIGTRMRVHIEQEHTQEKEAFFRLREMFKALQDKTWELAQVCVSRQYPKKRCGHGTLSSRQVRECKYYCER